MSHKDDDDFFDLFQKEWIKRFKVLQEKRDIVLDKTILELSKSAHDTKFIKKELLYQLNQMCFLASEINLIVPAQSFDKNIENYLFVNDIPFFKHEEKLFDVIIQSDGREYKVLDAKLLGFIVRWWTNFLKLNEKDFVRFRGEECYICWSSILFHLSYLEAIFIPYFKKLEAPELRKKEVAALVPYFSKKQRRYKLYSIALEEYFLSMYQIHFIFPVEKIASLIDSDCRTTSHRRIGFINKFKVDEDKLNNKELLGYPFTFNRHIQINKGPIIEHLNSIVARHK